MKIAITVFACIFQEKGNQMMDKAGNAAQSAKETMQEVIRWIRVFSFDMFDTLDMN